MDQHGEFIKSLESAQHAFGITSAARDGLLVVRAQLKLKRDIGIMVTRIFIRLWQNGLDEVLAWGRPFMGNLQCYVILLYKVSNFHCVTNICLFCT